MRAVNLIPGDARRRGPSVSAGLPFLGLVGGLVLVLVATLLFVTAHDRVNSRRAQLARTQSDLARWTAAAGAYAHDLTLSSSRQAVVTSIEGLAASRYDWSLLLSRLGDEMPARSVISSLAVTPAAAASSAASSTTPSASASSANASSIAVTACAASQSVIAQTMQNLQRVHGISQVTLGPSSDTGSTAGSSGACPYSWSFSLTLGFAPPAATATGARSAAQAASDPSTTSPTGGAQ